MYRAASLPEIPEQKKIDATIDEPQTDVAFNISTYNEKGTKWKLPALQRYATEPNLRRSKEPKKEEPRKYVGRANLATVLRSETLPTSDGKRSTCTREDTIHIFLLLASTQDITRLEVSPDISIGPQKTPRPNIFTDIWGLDADSKGHLEGKSSCTADVWRKERDEKERRKPASLKGKIARLLGCPIQEVDLTAGPILITNMEAKIRDYGIFHGGVIGVRINEKMRRRRLKGQPPLAPLVTGVPKGQEINRRERIKKAKYMPELSSSTRVVDPTSEPYSMTMSPYIRRQKIHDKFLIMPAWRTQSLPALFGTPGKKDSVAGRQESGGNFTNYKEDGVYDNQTVKGIRRNFEQNKGFYERRAKCSDAKFLRKTIRVLLQQSVEPKEIFAGWKNCFYEQKRAKAEADHGRRKNAAFG